MPEIRKWETARVLRAVMCAFAAAFLVAAFLAPDVTEMLPGLKRICLGTAQLTKDYFKPEIGSISGAMLNTALVCAVYCALMFLPEAKVTGATVLGYFLTMGFCSFGINILNMAPLMLGILVYARIMRQPPGRFLNLFMFTTGLAPVISEMLFRYPGAEQVHGVTLPGIALALLVGLAIGLTMPPLCAHSQALHKGYNLYNAGPAAGFLCFLIYAVMYKNRGIEAPAIGAALGEGHPHFANILCSTLYLLCLAAGLMLNRGPGDFGELLRDSGYRSDFTEKYSAGANLMNLGLSGLFVLLFFNLIGAPFTGVTTGLVFCMACCACNGATPLNMAPIMGGYLVMGLLNRMGVTAFPVNAQGIVVGLCFACGLAPISGEYGPVAGVAAGMLHYCMVTSAPVIHGGFNLYNGGFTAGVVCILYIPFLEHFFGKRRDRGR